MDKQSLPSKEGKHILVFGTSITYGAWDSEGGWVARLRKYIDKEINRGSEEDTVMVYNLGISGDKSADILKRFKGEVEARKGRHNEETAIIFDLGINDSIFNQQFGKTEVSVEKFKENLTKLVDMAKKYTKEIVVIGSMPVDSRVDPMPWAPGRSYQNEHVKRFNLTMKEVAIKEDVDFIEVFNEFIDSDYSKLLADGVHLNDEGHKKFYEVIRDMLEDFAII